MSIPTRYTKVAILLHWIMTIMIIGNLVLALAWEAVSEEQEAPLVNLHISIGLSVLGLVVVRILWRLTHPVPALPERFAAWEKRLAQAVHGLLYLAMIGVPMGGYIMLSTWKDAAKYPLQLFGLVEIPYIAPLLTLEPGLRSSIHHLFEELHELGGWTLAGLIGLHVVGALKHQFLDGDPTLQRMMLREPPAD